MVTDKGVEHNIPFNAHLVITATSWTYREQPPGIKCPRKNAGPMVTIIDHMYIDHYDHYDH